MANMEVQGFLAPDSGPKRVYFTGLQNDESTALTTTAMPVGAVVCYTETGGKKGRGVDVTKCETALLTLFAGIVIDMSDPKVGQIAVAGDGSGTTAGNLIPGWVTIVAASPAVQAYTHANMTKPSTAVFPMAVAAAQWYLQIATGVALTTTNSSTVVTGQSQVVAIALETFDSSTTSALKYVRLGGIIGGQSI
jgi:hypothetical protein